LLVLFIKCNRNETFKEYENARKGKERNAYRFLGKTRRKENNRKI
jgi:hypothetical protein